MQNSTTQKPIRQAENEILEALTAQYDQGEDILETLQDIRALLRYASAERHELGELLNQRAGELVDWIGLGRRDVYDLRAIVEAGGKAKPAKVERASHREKQPSKRRPRVLPSRESK